MNKIKAKLCGVSLDAIQKVKKLLDEQKFVAV